MTQTLYLVLLCFSVLLDILADTDFFDYIKKQCHLFSLWHFIQIWMALTLGQHSLISTWWHILLQNQQSQLKIMCLGFLALNCTRVLD